MYRCFTWMSAFLVFPAGSVWAHPGHGVTDSAGPAHYVIEPLHALPILLLALAIGGVWAATRLWRTASDRSQRNSDV